MPNRDPLSIPGSILPQSRLPQMLGNIYDNRIKAEQQKQAKKEQDAQDLLGSFNVDGKKWDIKVSKIQNESQKLKDYWIDKFVQSNGNLTPQDVAEMNWQINNLKQNAIGTDGQREYIKQYEKLITTDKDGVWNTPENVAMLDEFKFPENHMDNPVVKERMDKLMKEEGLSLEMASIVYGSRYADKYKPIPKAKPIDYIEIAKEDAKEIVAEKYPLKPYKDPITNNWIYPTKTATPEDESDFIAEQRWRTTPEIQSQVSLDEYKKTQRSFRKDEVAQQIRTPKGGSGKLTEDMIQPIQPATINVGTGGYGVKSLEGGYSQEVSGGYDVEISPSVAYNISTGAEASMPFSVKGKLIEVVAGDPKQWGLKTTAKADVYGVVVVPHYEEQTVNGKKKWIASKSKSDYIAMPIKDFAKTDQDKFDIEGLKEKAGINNKTTYGTYRGLSVNKDNKGYYVIQGNKRINLSK